MIAKEFLQHLMEECVDGEYQNFKSKGGAYTREHFFGNRYPQIEGHGCEYDRRGNLALQAWWP